MLNTNGSPNQSRLQIIRPRDRNLAKCRGGPGQISDPRRCETAARSRKFGECHSTRYGPNTSCNTTRRDALSSQPAIQPSSQPASQVASQPASQLAYPIVLALTAISRLSLMLSPAVAVTRYRCNRHALIMQMSLGRREPLLMSDWHVHLGYIERRNAFRLSVMHARMHPRTRVSSRIGQ